MEKSFDLLKNLGASSYYDQWTEILNQALKSFDLMKNQAIFYENSRSHENQKNANFDLMKFRSVDWKSKNFYQYDF